MTARTKPKSRKKRKKNLKRQLKVYGLRAFKWSAVAAVWGGIALTALVGWYAVELPRIIETPRIETHASIGFRAVDGTLLPRYGELKENAVNVEDLPPVLIYAVLATEDRRFYDHHGIDLTGMARAMVTNLKAGRVAQGGSTITQQLAKNLFLTQDRTLKRKIQEALLALWLEHELTKDEILSTYLNRVYFGAGAYGIEAAAQTYFHKSSRDLTLKESATIAGLLKAPSRYSPLANPAQSARRTKIVLSAMHDAGYISEEEMLSQTSRLPVPERKPSETASTRYFTDWTLEQTRDLTGGARRDLIVDTTLVPQVQKTAESALARVIREHGEEKHITQGAVVVMDLSGAVVAMVGGHNYSANQFNRATKALRPPGSSFKPVVYLTALQNGWNPNDLIEDSPIKIGKYRPENYKREYHGEVPLHEALAHSLNTAAIRLAMDVGIKNVVRTARQLGIRSALEPDLSLALGSSGVPVLEMATAYGTLARGGVALSPFGVFRVAGKDDGRVYYMRRPDAEDIRVVDPDAVMNLTGMMEEVIDDGTGQRAQVPFSAAGKTGTSQDFRDAWFIGFTDKFVAAVWLGNDDNSSMKNVTGGSFPAEIWRDVILSAHDYAARNRQRGLPPLSALDQEPAAGQSGGFLERLLSFQASP